MLKNKAERGELKGILIEGDGQSQLLCQLFIDDTGLFLEMNEENFKVAMEVVSTYERILGARLNLEKSTIIQLDASLKLAWLRETGCKVTSVDEVIVYLGIPIGYRLSASREMEFVLEKVQRRLYHWSNRMLTMQGRLVLMKHVLRAIPIFHLMTLKLLKDGFLSLEGLCREFLWGKNDQGNPRQPLIAWDTITHGNTRGGLEIQCFEQQTKLLKLRNFARLLKGHRSEWVSMAREMIKTSLRSGPDRKEQRLWHPAEAMLLLPDLKTNLKTVNVILEGWFEVRDKLRFEFKHDLIPASVTIKQALLLMDIHQGAISIEGEQILAYSKARNLAMVGDLWLEEGGWKSVDQIQGDLQATRFASPKALRGLLAALRSSKGCDVDLRLQDSTGWGWPVSGALGSNWSLNMSQWKQLLPEEEGNHTQFNQRWSTNYSDAEWTKIWKQVWSGWGISRAKFMCWRVLQHGFFTNSRGAWWAACTDVCPRCKRSGENISHLFFGC